MKRCKKILCIVLCLLLLGSVPFAASASDIPERMSEALRLDEQGQLKIMHVTDTHLKLDILENSIRLLELACDKEQPNLVIITGDNAMSNDPEELLTCIDRLMKVFDVRNIPVAVTYGNHDTQEGVPATREGITDVYLSYDCCINPQDKTVFPWCGTFCIPVLNHEGTKTQFNLFVFDSGDYDVNGNYANVLENQVEWYETVSKKAEQENGRKVYALSFQHIIVPEIYDVLSSTRVWGAYKFEHIYPNGRYYYFNRNMQNKGFLNETPCPGYINHGQFPAMVARGDMMAMFFGHDHTNCFTVNNQGIDLCNSLSSRYTDDAFSTQYGYRIITLDESDLDGYTSKVNHWYDFFDLDDVRTFRSSGDKDTANLAGKILFRGFFKKLGQRIAQIVTLIFTTRIAYYPD